jgi:DNA-binding MarR family transcriptional regulator
VSALDRTSELRVVPDGASSGSLSSIAPSTGSARLEYVSQRLARAFNRATEAIALRHEISVPEYHLLLVLSDDVARSNAELARRTFVSAQAAHLVVTDLEGRGLIERTRHPEHGRIRLVKLTDRGRLVLDSCLNEMIQVEERIYAGLSAPERRHLLSALNNAAEVLAGGYFGDRDAERNAEARRTDVRAGRKAASGRASTRRAAESG